jgi:hypothetical protein
MARVSILRYKHHSRLLISEKRAVTGYYIDTEYLFNRWFEIVNNSSWFVIFVSPKAASQSTELAVHVVSLCNCGSVTGNFFRH